MKELDEDLAVAQFIQDERDGAKEGGYLDRSLNDSAIKKLSPKELIYDIPKDKLSEDIKRMEDLKSNRLLENTEETDFTKLEELVDELVDLGAIYK